LRLRAGRGPADAPQAILSGDRQEIRARAAQLALYRLLGALRTG
jgi:hypothetical protein